MIYILLVSSRSHCIVGWGFSVLIGGFEKKLKSVNSLSDRNSPIVKKNEEKFRKDLDEGWEMLFLLSKLRLFSEFGATIQVNIYFALTHAPASSRTYDFHGFGLGQVVPETPIPVVSPSRSTSIRRAPTKMHVTSSSTPTTLFPHFGYGSVLSGRGSNSNSTKSEAPASFPRPLKSPVYRPWQPHNELPPLSNLNGATQGVPRCPTVLSYNGASRNRTQSGYYWVFVTSRLNVWSQSGTFKLAETVDLPLPWQITHSGRALLASNSFLC